MSDSATISPPFTASAVEAPNAFSNNLAANLKALNAKERDHLMRLAYLGAQEAYATTSCWLSPAMTAKLKAHAGEQAECVFASMDYHLDWIYAALLGACGKRSFDDGLGQALAIDPDCGDPSLQAVIGIQEDVDLIALFADSTDTWLLLIEAKGDAGFGSKQLARKLIRLDRILLQSGALEHLKPKLVLVAPKEPASKDFLEHAGKAKDMAQHLGTHASGIGRAVSFVPLENFPKSLKRITRTRGADGEFSDWVLEAR